MSDTTLTDSGSAVLPVQLIQPTTSWVPVRLGELWEYRELIYFLTWRAVKLRYKQTALGVLWAVIQPVFTMIVFTVVFSRIGNIASEGVPYPLFVFGALLPWQLFSFALTESSNSVVSNQALITKVYFPRLIIPLAAVCVGLVDFFVACAVLGVLMAYYGVLPGLAVLTLPMWTAAVILAALGVGLWLSALNVQFRDIRYTLPFLMQMWLLVTPVAYPLSAVGPAWVWLYSLNPMVGVVSGFRWALFGTVPASPAALVGSAIVVGVVFVSGLFYFKRVERTFADVV